MAHAEGCRSFCSCTLTRLEGLPVHTLLGDYHPDEVIRHVLLDLHCIPSSVALLFTVSHSCGGLLSAMFTSIFLRHILVLSLLKTLC